MGDLPYFISVEEAQAICNTTPLPTRVEHVPLAQATGRVLAEDLKSKVDDPPFDNSAMDGFACMFDPKATYPLPVSYTHLTLPTTPYV